MINPYLQMSRLVGRDLDFGMVEHFVGKYIDDAIRHNGQSFSDASNDLKQFFVQLSDAVFQATVNYEERLDSYSPATIIEINDQVPTIDEKLLTVKEVSEILHVTPQMVRNYISEGNLQSVKLSERKTMVKKSALDLFIQSK